MEITRVAAQASDKAKAEAKDRARLTLMVRENAANSAVEEAATKIRVGEESEGAERERAKFDSRPWAESEIIEEA